MAISYFKSSQVHVFPCAYRGTSAQNAIDPEARLNTEKNLTNTGNNLKGTYLIERKQSTNIDLLRVVIGGYYFEIDLTVSGGIVWSDLQDKYLAIKLASPDLTTGYQTKVLAKYTDGLSGYLDEGTNNTFLGLAICETDTEAAEATAKIKIADNNGSILNDAYLPGISSSTGSKSLASSGCTANGDHATAFGKGLTGTDTAGQMVIGSYNGSADGKLFVIGKGSVGSTSNAFTVDINGNTDIAGYLKVNTDKFTVATNGNTAIAGTLGVTGATALTSATLSSTLEVTGEATFNNNVNLNNATSKETILKKGYLSFGAKSTQLINNKGYISCDGNAMFKGDNGVSTDKLNSASGVDITLLKSIKPNDSNVTLGESGIPFNTTYINNITADGAMKLTGSSIILSVANNNSTVYADKNLYVGADTGASFSGKGSIYATKNIEAGDKITAGQDGIQSNGDIKIASGKYLDLSGSSTGSIKLRGETTTGSTSYAVVGNGIYNITFKSNLGSAPNSTYSVTMALVIPSTASLLDSTIYSSEVYRNGQYGWQIKAVHGTYGWTLTFTSGGNSASCNWFVTKIADVA